VHTEKTIAQFTVQNRKNETKKERLEKKQSTPRLPIERGTFRCHQDKELKRRPFLATFIKSSIAHGFKEVWGSRRGPPRCRKTKAAEVCENVLAVGANGGEGAQGKTAK